MNGFAYDGGVHNMTATSDWVEYPTTDIFGNSTNSGTSPSPWVQMACLAWATKQCACHGVERRHDTATRIRNGVVDR